MMILVYNLKLRSNGLNQKLVKLIKPINDIKNKEDADEYNEK
jgi:hypothetical protein